MNGCAGKIVNHPFRKLGIVLSVLAMFAVLFLPAVHAVAASSDIQASMSTDYSAPDSDQHNEKMGDAAGHCDMQSCSSCFPVPGFNHKNVTEFAEVKFVWLAGSVHFRKHAPPLRPPKLS